MTEGFLGRWSRRKQAHAVATPAAQEAEAAQLEGASVLAPPESQGSPVAIQPTPETSPAQPVLASMQDVEAATPQDSFAPFVARGVAPEVRNAAMKKLFTDPHFNLMDRLDIYIDDYSQADPLPAAMLRQLASAQFLKLVEEAPEAQAVKPLSAEPTAEVPLLSPTTPMPEPVPVNAPDVCSEPSQHHDHTDLRLQPNDAPGPAQSGRHAE